jgi:hypothetical protein
VRSFRFPACFIAACAILLTFGLPAAEARGVGADSATSGRFLRFGLGELDLWGGIQNEYFSGYSPDASIISGRALDLTYCFNRFGVGVTGFEFMFSFSNDNPWGIEGIGVLHGRYIFSNRRLKTGFLYNSVPTCYAEAAIGMGQTDIGSPWAPYGRLSLATEYEYLGLGAGAELGTIALAPWARRTPEEANNVIYLELKLRLLTGSIRL